VNYASEHHALNLYTTASGHWINKMKSKVHVNMDHLSLANHQHLLHDSYKHMD